MAPELRDRMRALRRPVTAPKLHWADLQEPDRAKVVQVVAELRAEYLVVVGTPVDLRRQERARRKCLERMLEHLQSWNVGLYLLEQRTELLNKKDMNTVNAARQSRRITGSIRLEHVAPSTEPLAWVADVIAAVRARAKSGRKDYGELLQDKLVEDELDLL
ncbi:hypothetical protein [Allonocardiopsis opalescens]|nr:hypothetical protein [Allonocardiopsis opalescens]